jgi:hypothetical protein
MSAHERRRLALTVIAAMAALVVLVFFGLIVERGSRTPSIQVGQPIGIITHADLLYRM